MARYPTHTIDDAVRAHLESEKSFIAKVEKSLKREMPSSLEKAHEDLLRSRYNFGTFPASNVMLRRWVFKSVLDSILDLHRREPNLKFCHFTIFDEGWNTGDRHTKFNLDNIKRRVRNAFAKVGIKNYIAIVEVQAYVNVLHEEDGRMVNFHVHALVFEDDSVKLSRCATGIRHLFKAPAILQCEAMSMKSVLASPVNDGEGGLAWRVYYLLKLPEVLKSFYRSSDRRFAKTRNASSKSERFVVYSRLMEVLSLVELPDMIFSGGKGTVIRRLAIKKMTIKAHSRRPQNCNVHLSTASQIRGFWKRFRVRMGQERFLPVVVGEQDKL